MSGGQRIGAVEEAASVLLEFEVDQDYPVDPFDLIDKLGLSLSFTRLDNLLGALLPQGNGGVLITSERPASVQRYTAAHEIGHWRLHQAFAADTEDEIFRGSSSVIETEAQIFASYLLMPEPLLQSAVVRYGLQRGDVTPEQVYLLSRDLFVSFEAAARRLQTAHFLSNHDVAALTSLGRLTALQRAFGGLRPADGYADMWSVELPSNDVVPIAVSERDEITISLPEHRLSGWRWQEPEQLALRNQRIIRRDRLRPPTDSSASADSAPDATVMPLKPPAVKRPAELAAALAMLPTESAAAVTEPSTAPSSMPVVFDQYLPDGELQDVSVLRLAREDLARGSEIENTDAVYVGGIGLRKLVLRCNEAGQWQFRTSYADAYDPEVAPIIEFTVNVEVQLTPTHAFRRKLLASADINERWPGDPDDDASFEGTAL